MNSFRTAAILLTVVSLTAPAWGQSGNCLERTFPLSIVSRDGSPLLNIGPNTFAGSVQGRAVKINSVELDQKPRRVLLLVDVSGSFLRISDWASETVVDVIEHISPPNEIGLATFSNSLNTLVPPTTDRTKIREQIESLFPPQDTRLPLTKRETALWDSIRGGVKLLDSHQIGDIIFLITDGMDNGSKTDASEATRSLLAGGIRLFTLQVIDPHIDRFRFAGGDPYVALSKVVGETGGLAVVPQPGSAAPPEKGRMPLWLRHDLDLQYRQMLYFFRIDVTLPQLLDKQRNWRFYVAAPGKSGKRNFDLIYPNSVLPCS